MDGIVKYFYVFIGLAIGSSLTVAINSVSALTITEKQDIITEQEYALKYTGMYQPVYDKPVKVFTYEKLCKGFYTIEDNGITRKYTGFGDLADEYTYTTDSIKVEKIASSTEEIIPVKDEILPIDTSSTTELFISN